MSFKLVEGFNILGQIRVLILLIFMIFFMIIFLIGIISDGFLGLTFEGSIAGFIISLVAVIILILFVSHHQKQLKEIEEERKKLDKL
jgi:membrane associated rhomboid family serine protease